MREKKSKCVCVYGKRNMRIVDQAYAHSAEMNIYAILDVKDVLHNSNKHKLISISSGSDSS